MKAKAIRIGVPGCATSGCAGSATHGVVIEEVGWLERRYCEACANLRARGINDSLAVSKPSSHDSEAKR